MSFKKTGLPVHKCTGKAHCLAAVELAGVSNLQLKGFGLEVGNEVRVVERKSYDWLLFCRPREVERRTE